MPFYYQLGKIPKKRHTQFKKEDGTLFREQVMGTKGFSGMQSILYHHYPPTQIVHYELLGDCRPVYEEQEALSPRHFLTNRYAEETDAVSGRHYILGNDDVLLAVVNPTKAMEFHYRNSDGDEVLFVHYGTGKIETMFGTLHYKPNDYIVIPVGTIYRVVPNDEPQKFFVVETTSWITTPKRYRNHHGQLLEHSPFCERDFHPPTELVTHDELGEFEVRTKARGFMHKHVLHHHPLDVVGWDGYLFPYIFSIDDFEPITGRIHMPPPIHQTFEGHNFVICSFVPRLYDYHPDAIPAPYYHSNVDSDEVLYYVKGNFMSRRGVSEQSITLHPSGIVHGPHPGTIEASIGKKETIELAVMVDTFRPLKVVKNSRPLEDEPYKQSWNH